ncbi:DUF790 family protein [Deltaproteobacteria bacterium TL4]
MLTKDLVRYKIKQNSIQPLFINPEDSMLLEVAQQLIEVFKQHVEETREVLTEHCKMLMEGNPCGALIARGLEKLLLDRTEFDMVPDDPLLSLRHRLFLHSSKLLSQSQISDIQSYYEQVAAPFDQPAHVLAESLYSDLPPYHRVVRFKPISAQGLLHRYNCAQVQSLLLHCEKLRLTLFETQTATLRQLFKYLRFHQLLAAITKSKDEGYQIEIDGPLSLFMQTQKYGLALASFFPAVLHQPRWKLSAEIRIQKQKPVALNLDETCHIRSHYHQFLSYIPEEIESFGKTFHNKLEDWEVEPSSEFIPLEGDSYCFPDFTFAHRSGFKISMELYHAWHAGPLNKRLKQLEKISSPLLILGVTHKLLKDELLAQTLEDSAYFSRFGFVFRELPTVEKVRPILESLRPST